MKTHPNTSSQYRELCMVNQVTCNNSQMLEIFIYMSVFFLRVSFLCSTRVSIFFTFGAGFLEKCAAFINDFFRVFKEIRSSKVSGEMTLKIQGYRLEILFSVKYSKLALNSQSLLINRHRRYFRDVNAAGV